MTYLNKIGGSQTVDRIIEEFFKRMDALPEARAVRDLHREDLAQTKGVMKRYFSEWLNRPAGIATPLGQSGLASRHATMPIGATERDAWMQCMREALHAVVTDEQIRSELEERLYQLADHLRNDEEK
ncbi:globin [Rhodomicrobium vannielii ATCC 17100]|jgi:hemoglobin|uniref:Globin n=1 Tax=Rhodomicrobium vannielii (strain ATCC 17100 / DSM 162 / LMG 4299 / NCIMB 10020 / ATH 3.1.1) TaxID=648757 RepID=E3I0U7_RHOVT|nr:group II truncated hemoglobin [Rhodomicrobium vannielii]ADP71187.1 globin [Rhodomicrobium vannielii ATCC 17100]